MRSPGVSVTRERTLRTRTSDPGVVVMNRIRIATWSEVPDRVPTAATVEDIDLVIIRRGDEHSVLYGRCLHRGALLADGDIVGRRPHLRLARLGLPIESGVSAYNNAEVLEKFTSVVEDDGALRRPRRGDPVEAAPSAAVLARRVPGPLHGSARRDPKSRT